MQLTFKVAFIGGEEITVSTSPVDVVRTEAYTNKTIATETPEMTQLYYMAYSAARRAGKAGQDFEKWLEDVAELTPIEAQAPKAKPSKG